MTALERMAKGFAASMDPNQPWECIPFALQGALIIHARAALEAIREPSETAVLAGDAAEYDCSEGINISRMIGNDGIAKVWGAMVDHILNGGD